MKEGKYEYKEEEKLMRRNISRETGSVNETKQKISYFLITTSSFEKKERNDKIFLRIYISTLV